MFVAKSSVISDLQVLAQSTVAVGMTDDISLHENSCVKAALNGIHAEISAVRGRLSNDTDVC